jgi:hypothetical protein
MINPKKMSVSSAENPGRHPGHPHIDGIAKTNEPVAIRQSDHKPALQSKRARLHSLIEIIILLGFTGYDHGRQGTTIRDHAINQFCNSRLCKWLPAFLTAGIFLVCVCCLLELVVAGWLINVSSHF